WAGYQRVNLTFKMLLSHRLYLLCHTGRFITAVFCTSLLFVLAHICFQTILYTYPPLDIAIGENCSQWDTISRHIGLSRCVKIQLIVRLHCPDVGVCVVALVTMILCNKLVRNREMVAAANITSVSHHGTVIFFVVTFACNDLSQFTSLYPSTQVQNKTNCGESRCTDSTSQTVAKVGSITLPSAFSAIYFLLFIGVCTWWACHLPISHLGFNALCVMVGFFTGGHMVCLYLYQSLLAQALFPPQSLWARLFGLKDIIIPGNCSSPYDLILNTDHDWPVYANPGILFFLYITIVTVLKTGYHATTKQVSYFNKRSTHGSCRLEFEPNDPYAFQVWSITYHSWLTFVLLLWACLIWILRARRHAATLCSPFILLYGLALCCLQYVWAMELQPELPTTVGSMSLRQLGLDRAQYPCLRLGSVMKVLGGMVMSCYAKYWIYVCGGMFIMVSFAGKLVGYKIVYMLLFLLCLCLYQLYYSLWRRLLKIFWWLVVAYTMLVLISIYTYQFEDFPGYWRNFTGFTEEQLAAIGLETFALSELFTSILIPGFFLLACILQLHYFHKPFMRITDLEHVTPRHSEPQSYSAVTIRVVVWVLLSVVCLSCVFLGFFPDIFLIFKFRTLRNTNKGKEKGEKKQAKKPNNLKSVKKKLVSVPLFVLHLFLSLSVELTPSKWGLVMDRLLVLSRRFSDNLTKVQVFLWRLLELHILKMVAFFSVWVALEEPSVMNLVLVVLWSLAMPYGRFRPMASCLSTIWVCVIIMCKMLYQLSVVNPAEYSSNCSLPVNTNLLPEEMMNSTLYKEPVDPAEWFGIRKDATVLGYSKNHLIVLMLLVFEATVYRHQTHHYCQLQRSPPNIPALFPSATRDTLDQGLLPCIKYLLNYTFYKFGLEICFLMTVNVIGQRMNFLVIIHGCWLVAILVRRRRAAIAKIWPRYCLFLSIFMIYQYLLCVGIPPALCIDYPWRWNTPVLMNSALIKWIYLPDFYTIPNSKNLIADFVLLMCASQQWKVFECEHKEEWMVLAGENTDDPDPMDGRLFNPAPNFINCRSYLDMAKVLVFRYLFWFVLSVVFVTGATRISVFGLGYLLACFFFLLFGTQLLVKPSRTRLALWDCLIIYNTAVIISKNVLSILACVFVFKMQEGFCWVIQLFSLVCTVKGYYDRKSINDRTCSLPVEEAGIIWDSICFLCLLLQRRVFLSFYFLHVTTELQASARQASRGFELFKASIYHPQPVWHKKSSKKKWHRPWLDHATVLHSGEYYLFESDSEDEEDLQSEEHKPQKQTAFQDGMCQLLHCSIAQSLVFVFQLAYQAWVSSVKAALRERQRRQRQLRRMETKLTEREGRGPGQQEGSSETGSSYLHPLLCVVCSAGHGEMVQRILDILRFLWAIVLAMVDGVTHWLNLLTKQYRETSTVLCNERYFIIHKIQQVTVLKLTFLVLKVQMNVPAHRYCDAVIGSIRQWQNPQTISKKGKFVATENLRTCILSELFHFANKISGSEVIQHFITFFIEELEESRKFYNNQNRLLKLLFAMYNLLAANSELVCYFIIILNNVVSASVISLVLPILVFLWAMLSVPRPTKRFWMTAIVFTEVMVVVKYLFQFGFFPWNSVYEMTLNEDKPFFPPRILGLEKTDNYIKYDLLQLLVLFFHRSLLMGPLEEQSPSPESCTDEGKPREGDEDGRRERGEEEEGGVSTASTQENLEMIELDSPGKVYQLLPYLYCLLTHKDPNIHWQPKTSTDLKYVYKPAQSFFGDILHAEYRAATDVYALMFLTDVIDFIIIVFGFWAFGKHSAAADIASTLSEDQVPEAFLVMLLIQFSTMIIDRALYLRKAVLGKLIFQVILVFGIHLWMFFILPAVTERMFNQNFVAQLWYFVKCIYFGLSAYQIRCGYPTRILGNFLTKKYNHLNLFLFQGFRLVPFLVELRAVMDWVWTDTTLSLSNWMCVEDIYANIFIIKCSRETEKKYPQPKGQKKKKIVKYGMGGLIIFFLICIIWFPLLFISLVRSVVGVVNHPIDVTVTVKLGGYEVIRTPVPKTLNVAMQFITLYSYEDIVTAMIEGSSGSVWRISPPSRQEVIKELLGSPVDLTLRLAWIWYNCVLSRHVPNMFPNYIRAPNGAEAKPVSQLYKGDDEGFLNITLSLMSDRSLNGSGNQEWWDIAIAGCESSSCDVLPMVIFNDKVSPPSLGFLAGYGIMGLYVSVVLVIGKFVRGFFSEISHSIMFEELPCVDRILKLCTDIFLVRETGELELEEELYSKLIFLYRSPETMIKWTRDIHSRDQDRY
uniref:Piezo-type mechanosensitive ion channel component 1 n=1 Tax=Sphaeramia orbicularis TaxID=375764 RepID=A0A673C7F3_9TELE